jgi:hypothetical protein
VRAVLDGREHPVVDQPPERVPTDPQIASRLADGEALRELGVACKPLDLGSQQPDRVEQMVGGLEVLGQSLTMPLKISNETPEGGSAARIGDN